VPLDFPCPECGASNRITVKQLKLEDVITCKSCKKPIQLTDGGSGKKAEKDIEKILDDFGKSLRDKKIKVNLRL